MGADTYCMTMWAMAVIAVFVFIALYFVKAGYGIFRTKQWGISINNKAAWVMMAAPVFIVCYICGQPTGHPPPYPLSSRFCSSNSIISSDLSSSLC